MKHRVWQYCGSGGGGNISGGGGGGGGKKKFKHKFILGGNLMIPFNFPQTIVFPFKRIGGSL